MTSPAPRLPVLLEELRSDLHSFLRRHAGWTLRYETGDDLLQGFLVRALERGRDFRYRGREPFLKWAYAVARTHLADRAAYWGALKRRSAALLRLTAGGTSSDPGAVGEPAAAATGPSTFASRRELLALAVKALAALPDRDRRIVRWTTEGAGIADIAGRLDLSYDAAKRARQRALERFRKVYRLASGRA